jgi:hypothetical protein
LTERDPKEEVQEQDGVWEDATPTTQIRIPTLLKTTTFRLTEEAEGMDVVTAEALQAEAVAEVSDLAEAVVGDP